jgi:RNA polymerase sigma-70 factor (ECF subfamily)
VSAAVVAAVSWSSGGGLRVTDLAGSADLDVVLALRRGDEGAFRDLVTRYHASMVNVASGFVPSRAVAEEVVQETWLAVLRGLDRFEGRASLKTWIFRILVNQARTRGVKEQRSVPLSSVAPSFDDDGPTVPAERFLESGHRWAGGWAAPPQPWSDVPAERLLDHETRQVIESAIATLPTQQREVITLRDVEQWTSDEVCDLLGLSEGNQRVLLHRARAKVRARLERHVAEVRA